MESEGKSEPIETGAPIAYPRLIEKRYEKRIFAAVDQMRAAVDKVVLAQLAPILRQARFENTRFDNYVDDLEKTFGDVRVVYGEEIPVERIERDVKDIGGAVDQQNASSFTAKIRAVTGVDVFASSPGLRNALNLWARQNVTLITTLSDEYFKDIERIVTDGVEAGKSLPTLTKEIQERTNTTKNRAKLIARDQVGKLTAKLTARRATEIGVKRFRWVTSMDDRVRASHRALNGKIFSYEEGAEVDGQKGVLPGEPINCRCSLSPILSSIGETKTATNKKVSSQSEIEKDIKKEEKKQPAINKRRQEKLVKAKEELKRS